MGTAGVGKAVPDFELTDATGKTYKLSDFKGNQAAVLVYGATRPVRHKHLARLRANIAEFEKQNAQVLVIDPHESRRVRHILRNVGTKPDEVLPPQHRGNTEARRDDDLVALADTAVAEDGTYRPSRLVTRAGRARHRGRATPTGRERARRG